MLKITTTHQGDRRTLVLEGKLVDPWVDELQKSWNEMQLQTQPGEVLIDLRDVTLISEQGENLLLQMMHEGANFNCRGVLTRHVVKQLERRREEQSRKGRGQS